MVFHIHVCVGSTFFFFFLFFLFPGPVSLVPSTVFHPIPERSLVFPPVPSQALPREWVSLRVSISPVLILFLSCNQRFISLQFIRILFAPRRAQLGTRCLGRAAGRREGPMAEVGTLPCLVRGCSLEAEDLGGRPTSPSV